MRDVLMLLFLIGIQNSSVGFGKLKLPENESDLPKDFQKKILTHKSIIRESNVKSAFKVRIKDVAQFTDIRDNQLVGYGLVVGLNGTGDSINAVPYTKESLTSMLERLGVSMREAGNLNGRNVAAVMVSAILPPFARHGSRIDVTVSALGNSRDLRGGTLLVTPLLSGRDEVMAVAQGQISVSGIEAVGRAASLTIGVPTSGKIINGAIIEKEVGFEMSSLKSLRLGLRNPDSTTSFRMAQAINHHFQENVARSLDPATIDIALSPYRRSHLVEFMMGIEQLEIEPDMTAKVYIDPTGAIVMGEKVKIAPVAITHGSITVRIFEKPEASQPNPFVLGVGSTLPSMPLPSGSSLSGPQNTGELPKNLRELSQLFSQQKQDLKSELEANLQSVQDNFKNLSIPTVRQQFQEESKFFNNLYYQKLQKLDLDYSDQVQRLKQQFNFDLRTQRKPFEVGDPLMNSDSDVDSFRDSPPLLENPPAYPLSPQTQILDRSELNIQEEQGRFAIVEGVTLEELVNSLNRLGTTPREMTEILRAIKAAGALQAEVIGA
jgi:flagellar P-ring protein precursor FlgI